MRKREYIVKYRVPDDDDLELVEYRELQCLRNLRHNLESGVIMSVSPDLVKLLMEKDWTNG